MDGASSACSDGVSDVGGRSPVTIRPYWVASDSENGADTSRPPEPYDMARSESSPLHTTILLLGKTRRAPYTTFFAPDGEAASEVPYGGDASGRIAECNPPWKSAPHGPPPAHHRPTIASSYSTNFKILRRCIFAKSPHPAHGDSYRNTLPHERVRSGEFSLREPPIRVRLSPPMLKSRRHNRRPERAGYNTRRPTYT